MDDLERVGGDSGQPGADQERAFGVVERDQRRRAEEMALGLGEQTTDEMALLFINVIPDRFLDLPKFLRAMAGRRAAQGAAP
jgi:hypothetical protein